MDLISIKQLRRLRKTAIILSEEWNYFLEAKFNQYYRYNKAKNLDYQKSIV